MTDKRTALIALQKGFSLIPLRGGDPTSDEYKRPLIPWQDFQVRRATPAEVVGWQTETYGVVTGPISNVFVVDLDSEEAAERFEQKYSKAFIKAKTRKGYHFFFQWDAGLEKKVTTKVRISADMDTRGAGGFVVAWDLKRLITADKLPMLPQEIVDQLPDKLEQKTNEPIETAFTKLVPGSRNNEFTRLAGSLRSRGYTSEFVFNVLRPQAEAVGFSLSELQTIVRSVERYPLGNSGPEEIRKAESIDRFLQTTEQVTWICEPFIANKTLGFVAGLPETGKTWAVIDLAIECARGGGMWLGKFPVSGGRVLFIDQERFKGETQRRFKAVINGKNLRLSDLRENLFIRCGTSTRLDLQPSFDAFRRELTDIRPDIVIVDSFVTFHNKEENNRKDIQDVLERVKQLRQEFGCAFVFIDHENKGVFHEKENEEQPSALRLAGSIGKPAAAEWVLTVRKLGGSESMVYHTKSTLAPTAPPFSMRVVDLNREKTAIRAEAF